MIRSSLLCLFMLTSAVALAQDESDPPMVEAELGADYQSTDDFVQPLSEHGSWVSENGVTAFQPSAQVVGADFSPYASHGQWVLTTVGWQFQTTLPFGWATYHYGRWYQSPTYGWLWVPGTQWGPSWVEWRNGGGYTGWAPLAPTHVAAYQPRWSFVVSNNLWRRDVYRYRVGHTVGWGATYGVPVYRGWHTGPTYRQRAWSAYSHPGRPVYQAPPPSSYRPGRYGGGGSNFHPAAPVNNGNRWNGGGPRGGGGFRGDGRGGDRGGRGGGDRGGQQRGGGRNGR